MIVLFYIAAGGALGAVARYGMSAGVTRLLGQGFPYGTLGVNVLGALAMGVLLGLFAKALPVSHEMRALLVVGFLGSFTTFSTFALDVVSLFERGAALATLGYIIGSVTLSVLAVVAGMALARMLWPA